MDRLERHDIINAVGLAVVLFLMALALVWGAQSLFGLGGEAIDAEKPLETTTTTAATVVEPETTTTTSIPLPHKNEEVKARVANAAGRSGVAGAGTRLLEQAGYDMLSPKDATVGPLDVSVIYYAEGYQADAESIARLLGVPESNIAPLGDDPGAPVDGAQVLAILGADTQVS